MALSPTSSRGASSPAALPLTLTGGSDTDPDLLVITEPDSAYLGNPLRVTDGVTDLLRASAIGELYVTAPPSQGGALLRLTDADSSQLNLQTQPLGAAKISGTAGLTIASEVGFFGAAPVTQPSVTGALSTVIDPAAKDVLTSLLAASTALGLASDGTT